MKLRQVMLYLLVAVVVISGGWMAWMILGHRDKTSAVSQPISDALPTAPGAVVLNTAKAHAAGIQTTRAESRIMQPRRDVPGRLQYDDTRHVQVKTAAAGVILDVYVKPGDRVKADQLLARISSPEVGSARADCLKRLDEREIAQHQADWEQTTCRGLESLVEAVQGKRDVHQISTDMENVKLGNYRQQILAAYSRYRLAATLADSVTDAADSGAIAGRTLLERRSERDAAEAALRSSIEQSLYEARYACAEAQIRLDDADRRLKISRQHLETLLGYKEPLAADSDRPLSEFDVRAAIGGTVVEKSFSVTERVANGDSLFTLADTSQLWAVADIRERQWGALCLEPGQELEVSSPAVPDQQLTAVLYYVGGEMSPLTNAVPLVATIDNRQGLLRPGQFIRMRVPVAQARTVLSVPLSAVVEHEGQSFVFVQQSPNVYRRVDVETGISDGYWVEIVRGVEADAPVVSEGAFVLKSELLLDREAE